MIIAEKQLKIPGKIYQLEIHCVSTQRPTTMEWLILTCVDRFGDSPQMKDETLKYAFEEVFRIPNSQILIGPPLKHLRELGVIEVDPEVKNYGDLQFGDIRLSQLGRQMLKEGAVPGQERTLSLYDTEAQKTVKSIPKKGTDPQLAAKAAEDLAEMKKNLKKTAKARNSKLFEEFLTGKTRPAIQWMDTYLKNPLLRQVAQLVVWNQNTDTFTLTADGTAIDCDGAPYEIDRGVAIGVAHPMEMSSGQVKKWRDYFVKEKLKQPFAQVWEPAIDPGSIRPDMYASWEIPYYRFMNQDQHGIHEHHNFYSGEWGIWFDDCEVSVDRNAPTVLQNIEDTVVVESIRFRTYTRKVNHIIAYLDKIAFIGRVLRDDASIGSSLDAFTQAQIMEFITAAMENHCVNSLAVLMDYKNRTFGEEDPMKEFTLE